MSGNNNNNSNSSLQLRQIASFLGATGVGLGAFGAHGLKKIFDKKPTGAENWKTAVYYQLFHSVAVLGIAAFQQLQQQKHINKNAPSTIISYETAGQLMGIGSILFSGSIYLLTLDIGPRKILGPTTPIGGLLMIAGWVVFGLVE